MAGAFYPLPFQKGAMEAEMPFHHWCSSRQIFGVRKIFARISVNFPEKFLCNFADRFSPIKIMKNFFWCDLQKKVKCFSANLGCHFLKSNNAGRNLYSDFKGFCQDVSKSNLLGVCLQPLHPHLQHHYYS